MTTSLKTRQDPELLEQEIRDCDRLYDWLEADALRTQLVPEVMRKINGRREGLTERDCMVILNVLQRWLDSQHSRKRT